MSTPGIHDRARLTPARTRVAGRALALALALSLAPFSAAAQETAQHGRPLTADERARELYLLGDRRYAEGNYDDAVEAFEQAYDLSRRPALLYNMANALERIGRYEEARRRLTEYVPHAPEHQRSTVLKRIQSLEARGDAQRRRDGAPPNTVPTTSAPSPQAPLPGAASAPDAPPLSDSDAPLSRERLLGYAIGGAGIASLGVGVAFGLSAASARSDAEALCVDGGQRTLCPASAGDPLSARKSRALVADLAMGLGIAAVGVGAYLVLSASEESGPTTELRGALVPDGGNVSLVTSF